MRLHAIAAVFGLFGTVGASGAQAAVALAYSPSSGRGASDNSSFNIDDVRRRAVSKCGAGCSVVFSGKGTCAAVVSAGRGQPWAVSRGTSVSTAANAAWHGCRRKGGVNCETVASVCE